MRLQQRRRPRARVAAASSRRCARPSSARQATARSSRLFALAAELERVTYRSTPSWCAASVEVRTRRSSRSHRPSRHRAGRVRSTRAGDARGDPTDNRKRRTKARDMASPSIPAGRVVRRSGTWTSRAASGSREFHRARASKSAERGPDATSPNSLSAPRAGQIARREPRVVQVHVVLVRVGHDVADRPGPRSRSL